MLLFFSPSHLFQILYKSPLPPSLPLPAKFSLYFPQRFLDNCLKKDNCFQSWVKLITYSWEWEPHSSTSGSTVSQKFFYLKDFSLLLVIPRGERESCLLSASPTPFIFIETVQNACTAFIYSETLAESLHNVKVLNIVTFKYCYI